jgi:hypothetical protein
VSMVWMLTSLRWSRVDTLFIQRRSAHQYSALSGFVSCLGGSERVIAA